MSAPECWFVTRTMRAIELLAFGPRSAAEVAELLQIHTRTARRMLNRLVDEGYVTRTEGTRRLYAPTLRIVALAGHVVEHSDIARTARPYVARLHEQTGVTAHLSTPSYDSILCLVHDAGQGPTMVRPQLRELAPAHCTAAGKVLLAWREPWRNSVLSRPLKRHTERTETDRDAVERELAAVRIRGHAVEDGGYQPGVRAVAAPVFSDTGEVVAALCVSGPQSRLPTLAARGAEVAAVAAELSAELGFAVESDELRAASGE